MDNVKVLKSDEHNNALFLGCAIHKGLEFDINKAREEYLANYNVINDLHINEIIKMDELIPRVKKLLPLGEYEVKIENDDFIGFIDLLVPVKEDGQVFDIYDFKYSNNVEHYLNSRQLHLYKYFFEKINDGKIIRDLYFIFIPKILIRQKKSENIFEFRKRLLKELDNSRIQILKIDYDYMKVIDFAFSIKTLLETTEFKKNENKLCKFCEYEKMCKEEIDYMILPKNERRNIKKSDRKAIWIYGSPFSGKTIFANDFPNPLMINTDGNIKFVDSAYLHIKDEIKV